MSSLYFHLKPPPLELSLIIKDDFKWGEIIPLKLHSTFITFKIEASFVHKNKTTELYCVSFIARLIKCFFVLKSFFNTVLMSSIWLKFELKNLKICLSICTYVRGFRNFWVGLRPLGPYSGFANQFTSYLISKFFIVFYWKIIIINIKIKFQWNILKYMTERFAEFYILFKFNAFKTFDSSDSTERARVVVIF